MEITSLDLTVLEKEFQVLEEGFVQKVYQRGKELTVDIYVPGDEKKSLIIGPSYCFISKYSRDNPERPPGFCMELRKKLGRVDSVYQKGFDRILVIESGDVSLVVEMFGKGNMILLEEDNVIGALRQEELADREIVVGEEYSFPEPVDDPREEGYTDLLGEGELVRRLAIDLSLGGVYSEEICERAGVEKNKEVGDLDRSELEDVKREVEEMFEQADKPEPVLYSEELPERAAPFELETFSEMEMEGFDTFSRALDEYFYRRIRKEKEKEKREKYEEKREGLERQLEQQERKIEGLEKSSEENREKAEKIYEEYSKLDEIKEAVEKGIEEEGWKKTAEKIRESDREMADLVKDFNEQEVFFIVAVGGYNLKLEPFEDLEATASRYYDKAKTSEEKIERAEEARKETEEKIEELGEEEIEVEEVEDKGDERSKEWFEKYRWFYSSGGFLVLAGRDEQTNDMLVKKHMEENDLYFHADFDGAPSVVVKDGKEAGEETIEEAAKAAVTFSKTWKAGITADDVYYVDPEQVTQEPESGEYLAKGAFVIRGDREYIRNVEIEAAIGPYEIEDGQYVPMCGPEKAVRKNCSGTVVLEPGRKKKSALAKEIKKKFWEEKDIELDLDYVIRSLPPGKSGLKD